MRAYRFITSLGLAAVATAAAACTGMVDFCSDDFCGTDGGADAGDAVQMPHRDATSVDAKAEAATHRDSGVRDSGADHFTLEASTPDAPVDAAHDTFVCDGTQPPSMAACVISETYGVFVAPAANGGSDTSGAGTRSKPYATISKALTSLGALKRVYVCNGAYMDQITLTGTVGIFGGLMCGSAEAGPGGPWAYASGTSATVTGTSPAFALEVNAGTAAVDVEDMRFDAAAGTSALPSSIAALVTGSSGVTMKRVTMTSGAGFAGEGGAAGSNYTGTQASSGNSPLAGSTATGGASLVCRCSDSSTSTGARGGDGDPTTPTGGGNGLPVVSGASATAGSGGTYNTLGLECTNGNTGAASPVAAGGTEGNSAGSLSAAGWTLGAAGIDGLTAGPAQGGGGGSGGISVSTTSGGGGGGGGCGGCGGGGGTGGGPGGSSFALLSVASTVTLDDCSLTAGGGGIGGTGGAGQAGEPGGFGGAANGGGCQGGKGSSGGMGGGGGGGAGGHSIAIGYIGTEPTMTNGTTTMFAATAAMGGAAGSGGSPVATAGAVGLAQGSMSF